MVVPDIEDVFVPLEHGFLATVYDAYSVMENILDQLPVWFGNNPVESAAFGSAVYAASTALADHGGKLLVFQSSLPSIGRGSLKPREEAKVLGTEKEKNLFAPADSFYPELAKECAMAGISIDVFLFPSSFTDIATLGVLSSATGGEIFYYPSFEAARDGTRFMNDLLKLLHREFVYDGLIKVRTSQGFAVDEWIGNFQTRDDGEVRLAGLDDERSLGLMLRHDGTIDEQQPVVIQCATLYTNQRGQRRIRVHNLGLAATSQVQGLYRGADVELIVNLLAKRAVASSLSIPLKTVRDQLTERCVKILTTYRKSCATGSSPGQLILPEMLKLLPIYSLALLKNVAFRLGGNVGSDERVHMMRSIKSMGVRSFAYLLYPRMYAVHTIASTVSPVHVLFCRAGPDVC